MYYVYIIRCFPNSLYSGITTDVKRRFSEHRKKDALGAKYTKSHDVLALESVWACENRSLASKLEYHLKKLSHKNKEELILSPSLFDILLKDKVDTTKYTYQKELLEELK